MADDFIAQLDDTLRAKRMSFDQIPVIDLAPLTATGDRTAMAQSINWALRNTGFMYVKNHDVRPEITAGAFDAAAALFDLPMDQKMALHISRSGEALRGYTEIFGENTDPDHTKDLKEVFDLGREAADGIARPFFGPNQWPASLPTFAATMTRYHDAMMDLAATILRGIALSLQLPIDYFDPIMTEPVSIQRMLHYPPQESFDGNRLIGIGAHSDYGCLTILAQDDVAGLQIMNREGDWVAAPPLPDTFVINIGDMMQRLTNDVYIANLHRVINTTGKRRYSLPFFYDVDFDTVFEPLPSCVTIDNPRKYGPIVCGQHKWQRYVKSFPHLNAAL